MRVIVVGISLALVPADTVRGVLALRDPEVLWTMLSVETRCPAVGSSVVPVRVPVSACLFHVCSYPSQGLPLAFARPALRLAPCALRLLAACIEIC